MSEGVGELFEALQECKRVGPIHPQTEEYTEKYYVPYVSTQKCGGGTRAMIHDVI